MICPRICISGMPLTRIFLAVELQQCHTLTCVYVLAKVIGLKQGNKTLLNPGHVRSDNNMTKTPNSPYFNEMQSD